MQYHWVRTKVDPLPHTYTHTHIKPNNQTATHTHVRSSLTQINCAFRAKLTQNDKNWARPRAGWQKAKIKKKNENEKNGG